MTANKGYMVYPPDDIGGLPNYRFTYLGLVFSTGTLETSCLRDLNKVHYTYIAVAIDKYRSLRQHFANDVVIGMYERERNQEPQYIDIIGLKFSLNVIGENVLSIIAAREKQDGENDSEGQDLSSC